MKKEDCIFCKIANGEIPSKTIFENDKFRVFFDLGPATKGHALLVPKEHFDNLYAMDDEFGREIIPTAKKVATVMKDVLAADGFNLVQNNGEEAGQSVFHFHMHLIPRYKNDHAMVLWKPGKTDEAELESMAVSIAEKLN